MRNQVFKSTLILGLAAIMLASSCHKPEKKTTVTTEEGFTLKFTAKFGTQDVAFKTGEYTRSNGEIMKVNNLAMILSKLSLIKSDNSKVLIGDGYLFVDYAGNKVSYNFKNLPAGDYIGISFQIGLDSAINHGDPTIWPADHPLNGNYTGLHWGWATGYIFQAIDGGYKKASSDPDWNGISLHTATDSMIRNYSLPFNFSLQDNSAKTAVIQTRVDEFFVNPNNITFATDGSFSHSIGTSEIALMKKILENEQDVFSITEVK